MTFKIFYDILIGNNINVGSKICGNGQFRSYNKLENACEKNGLGVDTEISRRTKGFICIRKGKETDYECILRHIRNSIAHNNVYYCDAGNRKFVLFEDYNKGGKFTARMLFSQTLYRLL